MAAKANPERLKDLAVTIGHALRSFPDIVQAEPGITGHLVQARDEAERRYVQVAEKHRCPKPIKV